jgi:holliday junction DNA helicase RuvA
MIAFLDGILVDGGCETTVAIGGGGIGLDVQLSENSAGQLPAVGEKVRLWTHLAVREDQWNLYGFVDQTERIMFRLLISVSGVGPKVALGMLSKTTPEDLAHYLRGGDEKALMSLKGVGKKSAARLVVELSARIPEDILVQEKGSAVGKSLPGTASGGNLGEAIAVLGAMGLPPGQAESALQKARQAMPEVSDDVEGWVRAALKAM